jgi:uncharacterized protein (UPF0332 family)
MSKPSENKALIQYRMKRARSTLRDAKLLYEQGGDPASIVNRAYYSMFYAALALLATKGYESSKKHQGVLAVFDQQFIKTKILPVEMGKFLHHAFDTRQLGDYEEDAELTKAKALQILESAVQFINSIEKKLATK